MRRGESALFPIGRCFRLDGYRERHLCPGGYIPGLYGRRRLDGFFRFPGVRWDDDRKIGQAAHERNVFDGLMGCAVTANGQATVADDDLYVEIGQTNRVAGDFQSPFREQRV